MIELLSKFAARCLARKPDILVIGDSMVDEYYDVTIDRISPEFPIPILKTENDEPTHVMPGGAANLIHQFKNLRCDTTLVSLLDKKTYNTIIKYSPETSIYNKPCNYVTFYDVVNPVKKRYYHGDTPFCRWDVETENYGITREEIGKFHKECLSLYLSSKTRSDVVIFSDYDKGVFTGEWEYTYDWRKAAPVTIVDPKTWGTMEWRHCTVFKPNYKDAIKFSTLTDPCEQCVFFVEELNCENVIITDEGKCVHIYNAKSDDFQTIYPSAKTSPRSVIGAGDCFTAYLATALSHDFSIFDAARIAFEAGLTYVQSVRNKPVTIHDIMNRVDPTRAKLKYSRVLSDFSSKKVIFTNGCFDLFHAGHLSTLEYAKSQGDILIVGVNTDSSVSRLKGPSRPIVPLNDRLALLMSLSCVDYVIPFHEDDPRTLINEIKPDIIVKGADWKQKPMPDIFGDIPILFAETVPGVSTTDIIGRIKS